MIVGDADEAGHEVRSDVIHFNLSSLTYYFLVSFLNH